MTSNTSPSALSIPLVLTALSLLIHPSVAPIAPECETSLLLLVPCAPFVQGSSAFPAQTCCTSVDGLADTRPECICALFNDTSDSSFPMMINRTLALRLPLLCKLTIASTSSCLGSLLPKAPTAPTNDSSSVDVSSATPPPPRVNLFFGKKNNGGRLEAKGVSSVMALVSVAALLLLPVL
ncbi:hypothetical protein QJS04_geneDACA020837 [Acorus gramineus]|uniref:Bifunctional inhibitor/plant lipid transfer protein/seed storage helical domain-containing protein n=1 Tax=Acorus gramineus TaxID=55184 RepID=A0AAV9BME3_ACOGR|nr:hypothetical protein QJS04_geneDACA020837 [Acorus gramineus]